ncbi:MAG: hypothetical protein M2R46_04054 [Verrucomicrobia subdivision 3 bacterium]|nr:hypothetical protein [Limisphaerales bacterium]
MSSAHGHCSLRAASRSFLSFFGKPEEYCGLDSGEFLMNCFEVLVKGCPGNALLVWKGAVGEFFNLILEMVELFENVFVHKGLPKGIGATHV